MVLLIEWSMDCHWLLTQLSSHSSQRSSAHLFRYCPWQRKYNQSYKWNNILQLSRLLVESRAPNWKRTGDLRLTRIKDPNRPGGQLLLFKHLEWQTLRFEAKAESNLVQTPLRLIANQATCRITLKKKLSDCSVLGARIMFIFDDLLWVLTDAQLLSAMHFADYLGQLIKRAPRRKNFAEDFIVGAHSPTLTTLKNMSASSAQTAQSTVSRLFSQYDIIETSHHIFVSRIEVHLCDDLDPNNGRSLHPSLKDGGALQITLSKLVIDVYPYQKVNGNRNHWLRYSDPSSSRSHWTNQHLQNYFDKKSKSMPPPPTPTTANRQSTRMGGRSSINQLMSRVVLIRLTDYLVSCVTTNMTSKLKLNEKLITTDKSAPLPEDMMAFYMELTSYYFFDTNESVPDSCAFIHLAPLKVTFDPLTLLWMNAFQANLHNAMVKLQEMIPQQEKQRLNTRIECLMPLIVIKCPEGLEYSAFEVKSARIVVLNCENESSVFDELNVLMEDMGSRPFMYDKQSFPWLESDPKPISDQFLSNLAKLKSNENSTDIWTIRMEPLWAEFRSRKTSKFQPLLDPLPVTLWAFESPPDTHSVSDREPDLSLVLCISSTVKVQLNHNQYLFLMRFLEQLSEFGVQMNSDTLTIQSHDNCNQNSIFKTISLITSIPNIEIVLKLSEELQTSRSIGISPQPSVLNLSSPSINEKLSIDSEMPTLVAGVESLDKLGVGAIPKSNSDSLLTGSVNSLDTNKSNPKSESKLQLDSSNGIHTSSSLATSLASIPSIQTHKKLQMSPNVISFKKSPNSDGFSLNSNSTYNESILTDSSPIDDDNRSIRSDLSGESDQFVVVGFETMTQEDDDLFGVARIESADEVKEDSIIDSPSDVSEANSASNTSPDTPISVTLIQIKVQNLNLAQQSRGFHSKILMNCSGISLSEFIKMPFSEYQIFVNQRMANKSIIDSNSSDNLSEVTLRLESYVKPDIKDELISVSVNHVESTLHMDTVMLLVDFVTDPDMAYVPPTHILVSDVRFTLIDDKVSVPPLCLNVPHLLIKRDRSNQMSVSPLSKSKTQTAVFSVCFDCFNLFLSLS